MEEQNKTDGFDWYYITYQGTGMVGCTVLPQHKVSGGGKNPDGMNLQAAYSLITASHGLPVIILSWKLITKKRADEFERFMSTVSSTELLKNRSRHLTLVQPDNHV